MDKMNFAELKEHVVIQCKEVKNHDKIMQELIYKIASIERNITNLIELQNTLQEFYNAVSSINRKTDQVEERLSELEDYLYEIRHYTRIKNKRNKRMIKISKKYEII